MKSWGSCFFVVILFLVSCGGSGSGKISVKDFSGGGAGADKSTVIATKTLDAGTVCEYGGVSIDSGIDTNGNSVLDLDEVDTTKVICNGKSGLNSLIRIYNEPSGVNCPSGGKRIATGLDKNINNELDADEITDTQYLCNAEGSGSEVVNVDTEGSVASISCFGVLGSGWESIGWGYELHQFASGDVIATAYVTDNLLQVGATQYYAFEQTGSINAPVIFTYDLGGELNNYGWWKIYLDRTTLNTYIEYNDTEFTPSMIQWVMTPDKCIVNDYVS